MAVSKRIFVIVSLAALLLVAACGPSTEELASEVQSNIEQHFEGQGIEVKSFELTHRGGNDYHGILETEEPHGEFTYPVDVVYDGNTFSWEIRQ